MSADYSLRTVFCLLFLGEELVFQYTILLCPYFLIALYKQRLYLTLGSAENAPTLCTEQILFVNAFKKFAFI